MGLTVAPYTLKDDNGEYSMPTQSGRLALDSSILALLGTTKIYIALLTQTGSSAPVATVLKNSLGGTVIWTRDSGGTYKGTLSSAFPSSKVFIFDKRRYLSFPEGENATLTLERGSDNEILATVSAGDDMLSGEEIMILVFP